MLQLDEVVAAPEAAELHGRVVALGSFERVGRERRLGQLLRQLRARAGAVADDRDGGAEPREHARSGLEQRLGLTIEAQRRHPAADVRADRSRQQARASRERDPDADLRREVNIGHDRDGGDIVGLAQTLERGADVRVERVREPLIEGRRISHDRLLARGWPAPG